MHNVCSEAEVEQVMTHALVAGVTQSKAEGKVFWSGYNGYFQDPNGFRYSMKRVERLEKVLVEASCAEPQLIFQNYPAPGQSGEFRGDEEFVVPGETG